MYQRQHTSHPRSLSARRAWIEICSSLDDILAGVSLSARRAWIEIDVTLYPKAAPSVALRKESVDRNRECITTIIICIVVALRKESVDRNLCCDYIFRLFKWSLSARRAWIEITVVGVLATLVTGRSPQGERG